MPPLLLKLLPSSRLRNEVFGLCSPPGKVAEMGVLRVGGAALEQERERLWSPGLADLKVVPRAASVARAVKE